MGTGAYTVVAVTAAEALGLPVEKIRVEMGDSNLPDGGMAGGSQMTATLTPAVMPSKPLRNSISRSVMLLKPQLPLHLGKKVSSLLFSLGVPTSVK